MDKVYRIVEKQNKFYIELEKELTIKSGFLFWRKKTVTKYWVNLWILPFKTLKEAKEKIELFKKEIKYYY